MMSNNIIWKDIPGYEGLYQVSNTGLVKSCSRVIPHARLGSKTINERILKPQKNGCGYHHVRLSKNNSVTIFLVHRLIADCFVPNHENKPCVNHLDSVRINNRAENLEWVSYHENIQHGLKSGLFFESQNGGHANASLTLDQVNEIRASQKTRKELREQYGVSKTIIARIINNKTWQHV